MGEVDSGVGNAGVIQLKGLRTSKGSGLPASAAFAAFVAQRGAYVVVLPSGNTEAEISMYRVPGAVVGPQVWVRVWVPVWVQACVVRLSRNGRIESRTKPCIQGGLLLASNLSRSTLINVNLTVCPLHPFPSITLRLVPPDGWRKRVE